MFYDIALQITTEKAKDWCQSEGNMPYFETSAKEAINLDQVFHTIVKKGLDQLEK